MTHNPNSKPRATVAGAGLEAFKASLTAIKQRHRQPTPRARNNSRRAARSSVNAAANDFAQRIGRLYGGHWSVTVDHVNGFVLISRQLGRRRGGAS